MSDQLKQDLNSTACGASALTDVLERTQQLLAIAMERMDRARNILTNGNPRPECNWGMLDTTDLRSNAEVRGAAPTEGETKP